MNEQTVDFGDLRTRTITGVILATVFIGMVWYDHGWPLLMLVSASGAIMVTELFLMIARERYLYAVIVAVLAAAGIWFGGRDAIPFAGLLALVVFSIGWLLAPAQWRAIFPAYVVVIGYACLSVFWMRDPGFAFCMWPAAVAIASDVGGYFGGRLMGGPKFWPSISPKKTWSGTITGWILAAIVGAVFAGLIDGGHNTLAFMFLSVLVALAAQMGDIAESAVKRRAGVKDASDLLPGHGGLLDRFDGILFAYVFAITLWQVGLI